MKFVIDTGILISALIKDSLTRQILLYPFMEFLLPEYALEELESHKDLIAKRSGLKNEEIELVLSVILEDITVVSQSKIKPYLKRAHSIIGDIDPSDVPFVALCLSVENDGIWSNDKHFEGLRDIRVWKTADIVKLLGKG